MSHAEMAPVAEGNVGVWRAIEDASRCIGKGLGIEVRGAQREAHDVAVANATAVPLNISDGVARGQHDRRREPEKLLDSSRDHRRARCQ